MSKAPAFAKASAFVFGVMAMVVVASFIKFQRTQKEVLFDPDGPSPRDPPHSEWAKAGKGTSGVCTAITVFLKPS